MKKICVLLMVLVLTQIASAQRLAVHRGTEYKDSLATIAATLPEYTVHFENAGKYLDTSAMCDVISWGLAAVSVGAFYSYNGGDSDPYRNIGIVCAAAALAAKVFSVSYKTKAGNELRLAAGALTLTF